MELGKKTLGMVLWVGCCRKGVGEGRMQSGSKFCDDDGGSGCVESSQSGLGTGATSMWKSAQIVSWW